jgi:hypothetical protein
MDAGYTMQQQHFNAPGVIMADKIDSARCELHNPFHSNIYVHWIGCVPLLVIVGIVIVNRENDLIHLLSPIPL